MGLLFNDLAGRELEWYCNVNMFNFAGILEDRFIKNWQYIFILGLGTKPPLNEYIRDRYINGMNYEDIAAKYGVNESSVKTVIDLHLEEMQSPRAVGLFETDYPLQLVEMRKQRFNGFYDNYAEWHEPEYLKGNGYKNISLFKLFDNYYFKKFAKKNNIMCMDDLCTWIDENKENILQKKAGIGKATAVLLLNNAYVANDISPDSKEILQKISIK